MVVELQIVLQRHFQIGPAVKTSLLQQLVDAAVEAFDHAVRFWLPQRSEMVPAVNAAQA